MNEQSRTISVRGGASSLQSKSSAVTTHNGVEPAPERKRNQTQALGLSPGETGYCAVMNPTDEVERAKRAADQPEHQAQRDRNQRRGVDEDQAAGGSETDPTATDNPVGADQARENEENESPG